MKRIDEKLKGELIDSAKTAKESGMSLNEVFGEFAARTGLKRGSVRNIYYSLLKEAKSDENVKRRYFGDGELPVSEVVGFDNIEARALVKKILLGATFGKPVRRTISEMTDDPVAALRYQNKYRNMIRYDRDTVFDVMDEIRGEFGKCFDPYLPKLSPVGDTERLKDEINKLYDRIALSVRRENEALKKQNAILTAEIEKLKGVGGRSSPVKDYFG
ncbi:MAG: hypothetical protein IJ706_07155 [Clostridia bacterium]|nr:hypothetical protein [Clostridia bacterium]